MRKGLWAAVINRMFFLLSCLVTLNVIALKLIFRNFSTLYRNHTAACIKKGLLNNTVSLFHP